MCGLTAVVLAYVADRMKFIPVHPFDNPIPSVVVHASAAAGGPDSRHDIEPIVGSAMKSVERKVLMVTGDTILCGAAELIRQGICR